MKKLQQVKIALRESERWVRAIFNQTVRIHPIDRANRDPHRRESGSVKIWWNHEQQSNS
ncbi:MAG: hypothetical protein V7K77_17180 [Nostoc sp.]|uniref:hypothetical protein n=1 Tax=Nostoc sp. TaxID=1180 RepID=UPI002FF6000C